MFLEVVDPRVIDDLSTRDRIKIRIGEPTAQGRFWISLVFFNRKDLERFANKLLEHVKEPQVPEA